MTISVNSRSGVPERLPSWKTSRPFAGESCAAQTEPSNLVTSATAGSGLPETGLPPFTALDLTETPTSFENASWLMGDHVLPPLSLWFQDSTEGCTYTTDLYQFLIVLCRYGMHVPCIIRAMSATVCGKSGMSNPVAIA